MAKIREDLTGVVSVGELNLKAGDVVPDGVSVGDHVLAPEEKPAGEDKPKRATRRKAADSEEE